MDSIEPKKEYRVKPSIRAKKAFDIMSENGGIISKAMVEAGYSPVTAATPSKLTDSKGWKELMDEHLSDESLAQKHKELLNSTKIEHMIFPLGPKGEDDINLSGGRTPSEDDDEEEEEKFVERTTLTDEEIKVMLSEVNCKVRRIVHGETARHVYYWAADNKARKDALDMGYKLKGAYAPEKKVVGHVDLNEEPTITDEITAKYEEEMRISILDVTPRTDEHNSVADTEQNQE